MVKTSWSSFLLFRGCNWFFCGTFWLWIGVWHQRFIQICSISIFSENWWSISGRTSICFTFLKGIFTERSPHPRYTFVWDLDVVLIKFTKWNWEVNLDLSLIDLTWKLAMLAIFKALNMWQNQIILYLDNLLNLRLGAKRPFVAFYAINFYVFLSWSWRLLTLTYLII